MNDLILYSDVVRGMIPAATVKVSLTVQIKLRRIRTAEESSVVRRSVAWSLLTHLNQS